MSANTQPTDADRRVQEALQALPRARASEDFTERVLERLELSTAASSIAEPSTVASPARHWLMAAAVLLVASFFAVREWNHSEERRQSLERLAALQAEYVMLETELDNLRQHADRARPVVYLGGDEQVDVVLDLARLAARKRQATSDDNGDEPLRLTPGGGSAPPAQRPRTVKYY